jgi:hypothetical protein
MAGKEATIYIVDVGSSMGEKRHGRDHTDLEWALEYVWDKITTTVCRHSFGDLVRGTLWLRRSEVGCVSLRVWADSMAGCDRQEDGANECYWVSHGRV